ncbi:MAG: hypothetical protein AB8I58_20960, partial [Anaerolineales bacterium]
SKKSDILISLQLFYLQYDILALLPVGRIAQIWAKNQCAPEFKHTKCYLAGMPNDFSKATLGRDVSGERPRYMNISPLRKVGKPSVCWMQYILPAPAVITSP